MNQKYKVLLFDLDDTILDFKKAEKTAISNLMEYYGIEVNDENINLYHNINKRYWKDLELGLVEREELLLLRFIDFFSKFNKTIDFDYAKSVNDKYFYELSSVVFLIPNSKEVLNNLKDKYKLYLITNGVKRVQDRRLALISDIRDLFEARFISEEIGYTKPDSGFAKYVLNEIKYKKEECLIIGDSLSSDIQLGINSGIDTCWYNPLKKERDRACTYEISNILDLLDIL